VQTDGSGNYVATNLTAGTYSITITAAGFETFKGKNIVLNVAEKHAFNAQLTPGSTSTTITVEDNPVQVDTETSGRPAPSRESRSGNLRSTAATSSS